MSTTRDGADQESKQRVADVAREEGMQYPCFLDVDSSWSKQIGVRTIPAFIVVDRRGKLAYRHMGRLRRDSNAFAALEHAIDQALTRSVVD